jgi:hypothetical protein
VIDLTSAMDVFVNLMDVFASSKAAGILSSAQCAEQSCHRHSLSLVASRSAGPRHDLGDRVAVRTGDLRAERNRQWEAGAEWRRQTPRHRPLWTR